MTSRRASMIVVVTMFLAPSYGAFAQTPAKKKVDERGLKSAVRFATAYTAAFQAGKGSPAVAEAWDFDSILKDIFGKELKKHTPAEVTEIKTRLHALVKSTVDNPDISWGLSKGQFTNYVATANDDGQVVVTYDFVIGETKAPNSITLAPYGQTWRVVDTEMNGHRLVMDLRDGYRKVAETVTPLKFAQLATAELEKQMKAKAAAPGKKP